MATDQQTGALLERMRTMSAADRSVLSAAVQALGDAEEVRVTTSPGSANEGLWSEMVAAGWMRRDQPLEVPVPSSVFIIPASAKERLETLLNELARDRIPEIFNALRRDLPPQIAEPVIAAGGTPSDVAMMLAGIVEATMQRWINNDLHEDFLRAVADRARDLALRR